MWAGITLPRFNEVDFERDFEPGAANLAYPDSKLGFLGFSFNLLSFSSDILIWSIFFKFFASSSYFVSSSFAWANFLLS